MRADLTGQIALLVGGETEIGREIGRRLADSGAELAFGSAHETCGRFGRLDIVVNCAPLAHSPRGLIDEMETDGAVLDAVTLCMRDAARTMRAQGSGRIVTAIGVGAHVVRRREGARSAIMAAIASLTRTAALELAADGVLVNAVAVGPGEDALSHIPIGRAPSPQSIANAVLFLCAPAASYVTGHVLVVDGGFSAGYVRNF